MNTEIKLLLATSSFFSVNIMISLFLGISELLPMLVVGLILGTIIHFISTKLISSKTEHQLLAWSSITWVITILAVIGGLLVEGMSAKSISEILIIVGIGQAIYIVTIAFSVKALEFITVNFNKPRTK